MHAEDTVPSLCLSMKLKCADRIRKQKYVPRKTIESFVPAFDFLIAAFEYEECLFLLAIVTD